MRRRPSRRTYRKGVSARWSPSVNSDEPELQALARAAEKVGAILNVAMLLPVLLALLAELSALLAIPFGFIAFLIKAFHISGFLAPLCGMVAGFLWRVTENLIKASVIPLVLAPVGIVQRFWRTARLTGQVEALSNPDTIPLLLWMYFRGGAGTRTRKRILSLLNRLSVEIKQDNLRLMDAKALKQMNRALSKEAFLNGENARGLCLALIQILQFHGNVESVRIVAAIAGETGRGSSDPALVELAARVLPEMRARMEKREADKTLLRASEAPEDPDTLLRPASGGQVEPSKQLLRPAGGENETE